MLADKTRLALVSINLQGWVLLWRHQGGLFRYRRLDKATNDVFQFVRNGVTFCVLYNVLISCHRTSLCHEAEFVGHVPVSCRLVAHPKTPSFLHPPATEPGA